MSPTVKLPMQTAAKQALQNPETHQSYASLRGYLEHAVETESSLFPKKASEEKFRNYLRAIDKDGNLDFARLGQFLSLNVNALALIDKIASGPVNTVDLPADDWVELANYNEATEHGGKIPSVGRFVEEYRDEIISHAIARAKHFHPSEVERVKAQIIGYQPSREAARR